MLPTQLLRAKAQNKNMNITLIMIQRFFFSNKRIKDGGADPINKNT